MKKFVLLNIVICIFGLIGCNHINQKQSITEDVVDFNQWYLKEHPNKIAVATSFIPTVDINYIDGLSLEELIIQNCYKEKTTYTCEDALEFRRELNANHHVSFKFVPDSSNLAKAYCLEDPSHFKKYNSEYCNNVCIKYKGIKKLCVRKMNRKPRKYGINIWSNYLGKIKLVSSNTHLKIFCA